MSNISLTLPQTTPEFLTENSTNDPTWNNVSTEIYMYWTNYGASKPGVCEMLRFGLEVIIMPLVAVCGVLGNTLSTIALWPDRNTSPTALLLIALAFVDDLVVVGWTATKISTKICTVIQTQACLHFMRYYYPIVIIYSWSANNVTLLMSTYMTVLVTAQRYISVSWPTQAKHWITLRNVRIALALTLVGSLAYNLPLLLANYIVYRADGVPIPVKPDWAKRPPYTIGYMVSIA